MMEGEEGTVITRPGEIWNCTNPGCQGSVEVRSGTYAEGSNPRCSCGGLMKKPYSSPVFRYLDFLRVEEPVNCAEISRGPRSK
jgi:hypothetical protein